MRSAAPSRTSRALGRTLAVAVALGVSAFACGAPDVPDAPGAGEADATDGLGRVRLSLDGAPGSVTRVRLDVEAMGDVVATATLELAPTSAEPGASLSASAFLALVPGDYTFRATALDAVGEPVVGCSAGAVTATVVADETVPVALTLTCGEAEVGQGDVVVVVAPRPRIDAVEVSPGLTLTACQALQARVRATSLDGAPLTYAWSVEAAPPDAVFVLTPAGDSAELRGDTAGAYTLRITVRGGAPDRESFVDLAVTVAAGAAPPVVVCNAPPAWRRSDLPATFTATATDACGAALTPVVTGHTCATCFASRVGPSLSLSSVAAVPESVTWTAVAVDAAGRTTTQTCGLEVRATPLGLIVAYAFDDGVGSVARDASPNRLDGTLGGGAAWVAAGRHGGALSFDGVDDVVTRATSPLMNVGAAFTLEAWVRPAAVAADWTTVVMRERAPSGLAWALYASDGANRPPAGYAFLGGADRSAVGVNALAADTWSHLAATFDGASLRLYVGGALVRTRAQAGTTSSNSGPLRVGGNGIWGEWFRGLIDEVRVYDRALTAAELATDMATPINAVP